MHDGWGCQVLAIERRNKILSLLQTDKKVVVSELSESFRVSEETIRRDLERMEKEGYCTKTYGGAIIKEDSAVELPFTVRKNTNVAGKQQIAKLIAIMIRDGDQIMLDASSTAVFVAQNIKKKKNITVITNSIEVLFELSDVTGWKILSTGGTMSEGSFALGGHQAEKMLSSFHVGKAVISCKGIDLKHGFTDTTEDAAQLKKTMLKNATKKILAVDSSKFDKISFTEIGSLKDITMIVTDVEPSEEWKQLFKSEGVVCVYPGMTWQTEN